jgi:sulfur carrier protein
MAITLELNGTQRTFDELTAPAPIASVVAALGLKQDRVAVEWNGEIAARTTWTESVVGDGDKLEIVHFVGGGSGREVSDIVSLDRVS